LSVFVPKNLAVPIPSLFSGYEDLSNFAPGDVAATERQQDDAQVSFFKGDLKVSSRI
jgi:hypothetical protein